MPKNGFYTISIKPITSKKLQKMTDKKYSMFNPTTLIIMMDEIKNGDYTICSHKLNLDLSGNYTTITIRSDVYEWLKKNFKKFATEYEKRYHQKRYHEKRFTFTAFVNYFILNIIESKNNSQNKSINLDKSNFSWLQKEYQKQRKNLPDLSFEEFTNIYIGDLFANIIKEKSNFQKKSYLG